ncbi:MAG: beta-ketoacyl-ACP synthase II, partial [Negativicutes bacterium]|nr:beta-ketoacyl-ACP synthase II [Negativicutes bacterium]
MKRRVVITGMGAVTPVGNNVTDFWQSLVAGRSGIGPITRFDASGYPVRIAGEVSGFDPADYMDKKEAKRMDRFTQFAVAASSMAIADGKLDLDKVDKTRVGTLIGSGIGGMETIHDNFRTLFERGHGRVSPFFIPMMISNMAAGQVSIIYGFQGLSCSIATACASATDAIGTAMRYLAAGDVDVMLAGGSESTISPIAVAGFSAMKALSTRNDDPQAASRPFDVDRDGFVMSEGAAVLLLETLEHARRRGAEIYAELVGYGHNSDAYHITAPAPDGEVAAACMAMALRDGQLAVTDIDYINAHGTSTPLNDRNETQAIKRLFGDHAYK